MLYTNILSKDPRGGGASEANTRSGLSDVGGSDTGFSSLFDSSEAV